MARSKTSTTAPEMPVRFFQLPDGQPVAVWSVAELVELVVLGSAGAKAQEASPVKEHRRPSLGKVIAGPTVAELKAQAPSKNCRLDEGARAASRKVVDEDSLSVIVGSRPAPVLVIYIGRQPHAIVGLGGTVDGRISDRDAAAFVRSQDVSRASPSSQI